MWKLFEKNIYTVFCFLVHETKYSRNPNTGHVRKVRCQMVLFWASFETLFEYPVLCPVFKWFGCHVKINIYILVWCTCTKVRFLNLQYSDPHFILKKFCTARMWITALWLTEHQIKHGNHLNTGHPYCPVFRWIRYSGVWYSNGYCTCPLIKYYLTFSYK